MATVRRSDDRNEAFSIWIFCLSHERKSPLDCDQPEFTDVSKKNQDSSRVTIFLKFCSSFDHNTHISWYDKVARSATWFMSRVCAALYNTWRHVIFGIFNPLAWYTCEWLLTRQLWNEAHEVSILGRSDLGSSSKPHVLSAKHMCYFSTAVRWYGCSWYTSLSSVWICWGRTPLRVKKHITVCCSNLLIRWDVQGVPATHQYPRTRWVSWNSANAKVFLFHRVSSGDTALAPCLHPAVEDAFQWTFHTPKMSPITRRSESQSANSHSDRNYIIWPKKSQSDGVTSDEHGECGSLFIPFCCTNYNDTFTVWGRALSIWTVDFRLVIPTWVLRPSDNGPRVT
jgi:hypothetical protein